MKGIPYRWEGEGSVGNSKHYGNIWFILQGISYREDEAGGNPQTDRGENKGRPVDNTIVY